MLEGLPEALRVCLSVSAVSVCTHTRVFIRVVREQNMGDAASPFPPLFQTSNFPSIPPGKESGIYGARLREGEEG